MHQRSAPATTHEAGAPHTDAPGPAAPTRRGRPLTAIPRWAEGSLSGLSVAWHLDSEVPAAHGALAVTMGRDIHLAPHAPGGDAGKRLLAHEMAHVVQQTAPDARLARSGPVSAAGAELEANLAAAAVMRGAPIPRLSRAAGPARQTDTAIMGPPNRIAEYPSAIGPVPHRLGESAGHRLLMAIETAADGTVTFEWFDLERGARVRGSPGQWESWQTVARVVGQAADLAPVQGMLTSAQWAAMPQDVTAELLRMHEQQTITLPDAAVLSGYRGMVYEQAMQSLQENEAAVDDLLRSGRVDHFRDFARSLKEASVIRDALVTRRDEIRHSLAQQQGFSLGYAGNTINLDTAHRLQLFRELDPVERTLRTWLQLFPLLTRLSTAQISPETIETTLRTIKANIESTRADLQLAPAGGGPIDLMKLDNARAAVNQRLGPRATATVRAEDERRHREALAEAGALVALSIALAFLPGGIFIDAAIGIAMAATSVEDAIVTGRAANTSMDVDAGITSQMAALGAELGAVLAVVGAALGAAAAGFRVVRLGRALLQVRTLMPELAVGEQLALTHLVLQRPSLVAAVRTVPELEAMLTGPGARIPFEQVVALRTLARRIAGAADRSLSADSLEAFLNLVWEQRATALGSQRGVYGLYSAATEANPLTRAEQAVLDDYAAIARARPAGAVTMTQRGQRVLALQTSGLLTPDRVGNTFFHFIRAGADPTRVTQRIYLNLAADEAATTMRSVVQHVVDDPAHFPGIAEAKIAGSSMLARRAETVVIYAESEGAAGNVVAWLREQQHLNPGVFRDSTPPMTEQVLRGVSEAAEPAVSGTSFGELRSNAIQQALVETAAGGDRGAFVARARELLAHSGVDLANPARNAP